MIEYATTFGLLQWDDGLNYVKVHDDPQPPKGEGWALVTTCLGEALPQKGRISAAASEAERLPQNGSGR